MAKLKVLFLLSLILIGYIIVVSYDLNLKNVQDQKEFASVFSKWAYKVTKNLSSLVGYITKQDWSPINKTQRSYNGTKTTNQYE